MRNITHGITWFHSQEQWDQPEQRKEDETYYAKYQATALAPVPTFGLYRSIGILQIIVDLFLLMPDCVGIRLALAILPGIRAGLALPGGVLVYRAKSNFIGTSALQMLYRYQWVR